MSTLGILTVAPSASLFRVHCVNLKRLSMFRSVCLPEADAPAGKASTAGLSVSDVQTP